MVPSRKKSEPLPLWRVARRAEYRPAVTSVLPLRATVMSAPSSGQREDKIRSDHVHRSMPRGLYDLWIVWESLRGVRGGGGGLERSGGREPEDTGTTHPGLVSSMGKQETPRTS